MLHCLLIGYSGEIVIPRGKVLNYVHAGFESVFEEEFHITIEKGIVKESKLIDFRACTSEGRHRSPPDCNM
jgi:hypothetical protein